LTAHRVDQRGERERRACGGENVHRERAGADEHAILDRHARVLTRATIIRSCYVLTAIPAKPGEYHLGPENQRKSPSGQPSIPARTNEF